MLDKETLQWDDNIFILKEVLNARQLRLTTNSTDIQYKEVNGKVTYLNISDRLEIRTEEKIDVTINKVVHNYNIANITKLGSSFLINSTNLTKTTLFILPILGYNKEHFCTDTYLENVFLNKELNQLCLVYRFIKGEVYNRLEAFLLKHDLFIKLIDIDPQHVMYIFRIPASFNMTISKFTNGKYSQFVDGYKLSILKFYGYKYGGTTYNILYKGIARKRQLELELECAIPDDLDLYDVPNMDYEVIDV